MDPHRQFHHPNHHHNHHHLPRHVMNSPPPPPPPPPPPSRYLPLHPQPPPPLPIFPEDRHRNLILQRHHSDHPDPPPPPPSHHNTFNFVSSPLRRLQQHRYIEHPRSPPRVTFPHNNNNNYNFINHNVVAEIDHPSRFRFNELHPSQSRVPLQDFSPPRFRNDFNPHPRVRARILHPQEGFGVRQHCRTDPIDARIEPNYDRNPRSFGVVGRSEGDIDHNRRNLGFVGRFEGDIDHNRRNFGVVGRLEGDIDHNHTSFGGVGRLEEDFDHNRRNLGVVDNHEIYHPEMVVRKGYELSPNDNECFRDGLVNDEVFLRDDVVLEENVKMRRSSSSGGGGGSKEVSRSPMKFRGGGIEVDDDFDDRVRKEDIKEYNSNSHDTPRKKSAFLRIQPAKSRKQQHSGFRNRFDSNSSPHKGKDSNSEFVDCRISEERVGSPVELNLAFKSNALVAKGITVVPSCSNAGFNIDNNVLSDSGIRLLDGESPSRVVRSKINSSNSKTEVKDSSNRVRVSPMKRLSNLNNGQTSDKKSLHNLSGKSNNRKASPNKNADFEKVSSPPVRKKRRAIIPFSRLSSVAPSKTDSESVNSDSLPNCPSDGSMPSESDTPEKQRNKELSCAGNSVGSAVSECVDMAKIDLNESSNVLDQVEAFVQDVCVEFASKKTREKEILDAFPDSIGSLRPEDSEGHGKGMLCLQGEQSISSNLDGELTKSVDKSSSDILNEKDGVEGQDAVSLSVINDSVEEFLKSIASCVENNKICSENTKAFDPVIVTSTAMNPVNVSDKRENEVDLNCPVVDSDTANTGLSLDIVNDPSIMHTEIHGKVGSVSIDISSDKSGPSVNDGSFTSKNSDPTNVLVTNNFQEQQYLVSETRLENDKFELGRYGSSNAGEKSSVINRKRKAGTEPNSLDLRIPESCLESDLSLSSTIENATLPKKVNSEVSGSSCVESEISLGNKFTESCKKGTNSMDSICDLDSNEILPSCGKKRKTLLMESYISDALGSQSSEFIPLANESSVKISPQLIEGITLPKPAIVEEELGGATSSLSEVICTSTNNSNSDNMCKDSCLSFIKSTHGHTDEKQPSLSEHGYKEENDGSSMMGGIDYKNEFMDIECDDTAPKSICGGVATNIENTPSDVALPDQSYLSSTVDVLNASIPTQACSVEKPSMDDKKSSQPLTTQKSSTSQVDLLPEIQKNFKPDISATSGIQPFTQKSASLSSKNAKTAPSSKFMNKTKRNVLTRSEPSLSFNQHKIIVNPSKKTQSYPSKPRTWHRANNSVASNTTVKKPSKGIAPPQRPLSGKGSKVQDSSYIRKGNSLVRNPASGATTSDDRALGAFIDRSKPNVKDQIRKEGCSSVIEPFDTSDGLVTGGRSSLIDVPKTPPLPSTGKTAQNDVSYTGKCTPSLPEYQSEGTVSQLVLKSSDTSLNPLGDPESIVNRNLEDPGTLSDGDVQASNSKRLIYIKRKSNQLIAASKASDLSVHSKDNIVASSSDNNYYKRRKNQLIRTSSEGSILQMLALVDDGSKSLSQSAVHVFPGISSKRLSNKGKSSKHSLVWKLGDSKSCGKGMEALRSGRLLSHLLPWKRTTYLSRKLLSSRKRSVLYVRSGRGFSLRRSKVLSLPGKSLKWSKSMEKRSKKVEREAGMAVAMDSVQKSRSSGNSSKEERSLQFSKKPVNGLKLHSGERIFRIGVFRYRMDPSRRTLQRISDEEVGLTSLKSQKDVRKTYVPKRLLIGSDEYVRIGNGNQLVRDPKRRTRILASEKVRWSLHTARMRLAKKRKFCQFFTRFGICNKGEGKCPFIHDPSKIAVCTKFLNGLCANPSCKLTHKVIPERMPECSFFLQGLCSNESCPYRHVSVNPKASICESFLRGYCAEGNKCRKKHSYICPEYEASGSCPRGSHCKLYHPKKGKPKKRKLQKNHNNSKGRYFGGSLSKVVDPETRPVIEKDGETQNSLGFDGYLGDFISLDVSDDDVDAEMQENGVVGSEQISLSGEDIMNFQVDDIDDLIKPIRILGSV